METYQVRNVSGLVADVSVIIPVHNRNELLRECLDSVYSQTLSPREVIVVDDCSDTPVRLPELPGLRVLRLHENRGPGGARNRGAELASQKLLLFLDSDDLLLPQTIQAHVNAVNENRAQGAWCNVLSTKCDAIVGRSPLPEAENQLVAMLRRNFIHSMSGLSVLRATFMDLKGFREDIRICEDFDFNVRLLSLSDVRLAEIGLFLVHRRLYGDNLTSQLVDWSRNLVRVHRDLLATPRLQPFFSDLQYGFERRLRRLVSMSTLSDKKLVRASLERVRRAGKCVNWQMRVAPTKPVPRFIPVHSSPPVFAGNAEIVLNLDWRTVSTVSPRVSSDLARQLAGWTAEKQVSVRCVPISTEVGDDDRVPLSLFALSAKTPVYVLSRPPAGPFLGSVLRKADAVITTRPDFADAAKSQGALTCLLKPRDGWHKAKSMLEPLTARYSKS